MFRNYFIVHKLFFLHALPLVIKGKEFEKVKKGKNDRDLDLYVSVILSLLLPATYT